MNPDVGEAYDQIFALTDSFVALRVRMWYVAAPFHSHIVEYRGIVDRVTADLFRDDCGR